MKSADGRFEYRDRDDRPVWDGTDAGDVHRFAYRCRGQPGAWCSVNLRGRGHDVDQRSWAWDGNFDKPTLTPSINCAGCWHGFIEGGVFNNTDHKPEAQQ
jgi:hypothetical protein